MPSNTRINEGSFYEFETKVLLKLLKIVKVIQALLIYAKTPMEIVPSIDMNGPCGKRYC